MHRELKKVADQFDNIQMTSGRFSTIWGGASLLEMLLSCMREALDVSGWTWDYFVNLSESDYPIKSVDRSGHFWSFGEIFGSDDCTRARWDEDVLNVMGDD